MNAKFRQVGFRHSTDLLLDEIQRQPDLWDFDRYWKDHPVPIFREVDTIYLRMPKRAPYAFATEAEQREAMRTIDPWEGFDEPCFEKLPVAREMIFDVMRTVQGERLGRVLLNRLPAGAHILAHADISPDLKYYERFHIPLITNKDVMFRCGNEQQPMKAGEVWWFDNATEHEVWNRGETDRIHLIIDIRTKGKP